MVNLLLHPLDAVVPVCGPVISRRQHEFLHLFCSLNLAQLQEKPFLQILKGLRKKARQSRPGHQIHHVLNVPVVSPCQQKALYHERQVELKGLRLGSPSHDPDHLISQLEGSPLEPQVVGRRSLKDEAKVDVNEVAFLLVNHDVAVVPVLHLQDVGNQRVRSLGPNEVLSGRLKHIMVLGPKVVDEKFIERFLVCLADRIPRNAVWNHLNNPPNVHLAARAIRQGPVGEQLQVKSVPLKYLQEEADHLQSQAVLPNVIKNLEDAGNFSVLRLPNSEGIAHAGRILWLSIIFEDGAEGNHEPGALDGHVGHWL